MCNERDEFREIVGDSIVAISAVAISEQLRHNVTDVLAGAFPRNYVYGVGDYKLIYLTKECFGDQHHGFARSASMIALYPDGQIRSGIVNLQVDSWSNHWKFREADMKPADPIDIVSYGPQLLMNLYSQVYSEVEEQEDPDRLKRMLAFLGSEPETCSEILEHSKNGLRAITGREKPEFISGEDEKIPKDIKMLMVAIETQFGLPEKIPVSAYQSAFELYENKEQIVSDFANLAKDYCIGPLYKKLKDFISTLDNEGLLPSYNFTYDNQEWFPDKSGVNHQCKIVPKAMSSKNGRWWVISPEGDVREARYENGATVLEYNPEDIIRNAPEIVRYIIDTVVKETFPKLGNKPTELPF